MRKMVFYVDDIAKILEVSDVEGLIQLGAPRDEYDDEARTLVAALNKLSTDQIDKANVTALIALVWEKQFNLTPDDLQKRLIAFQRIAQKLIK